MMTTSDLTINGEPPGCTYGLNFSADQAEWLVLGDIHHRYYALGWNIPIYHLDNGCWMNDSAVWEKQYESREAALRDACATTIRRARMLHRITTRLHMSMKISTDECQAVIDWALSLVGGVSRQVHVPAKLSPLATGQLELI